jgi:hypothetical protein
MKFKSDAGAYALQYVEDSATQPKLGEGVSRPRPKDSVRNYRLVVHFSAARPMVVGLNARNKSEAIMYAKNRWPAALKIVSS